MVASRAVGRITVIVSPGARRTEIVGRHGEGWKLRVTAAPESGRANEALTRLLAGALGVAPVDVAVVSGRVSRKKLVEVAALEGAEIEHRLDAVTSGGRTRRTTGMRRTFRSR